MTSARQLSTSFFNTWNAARANTRKLAQFAEGYRARRRLVDLDISAASGEMLWFAFLGEFGFGITSWLPWVKYIRETYSIRVGTVGIEGTAFLYGFSDQHIEVNASYAGHSWGLERDYRRLEEELRLKLIYPANERVRKILVNGANWENLIYDRTLQFRFYSPLVCQTESSLFSDERGRFGDYVVVNNKHYLNWNGADIPNFYNLDEISRICRFAAALRLNVILNVFADPVIDEQNNRYFAMQYADLNEPNLISLAPLYSRISDKADQNRFQAAVLAGARGVFATQGGNAHLSIICNRNVSVIFRGGTDYPSLVGLAKAYSCRLNIFSALEHVLRDRNVSVIDDGPGREGAANTAHFAQSV